jgi:hypothetical protein
MLRGAVMRPAGNRIWRTESGVRVIELHERLSEFSYGYGVTREVERLLASVGVITVPFMPSLLQEKKIGFDAGFGGKGVPVLLQFKLGQSLTRYVRSDVSQPSPLLNRPFFRFSLNTAEMDGQYETLLKAQTDGAEVYYVAPRFSDWAHYVSFFEEEAVLENSVMVTPGEIRDALVENGSPDGPHRIVYDRTRVHVCSKPAGIRDVRPSALAESVLVQVRSEGETLGGKVRRIYAGLSERAAIRRGKLQATSAGDVQSNADSVFPDIATLELDQRSPPALTREQRARRLANLRQRSRSEEDAVAIAVALEFWGLGIQLLFAVEQGAKTG